MMAEIGVTGPKKPFWVPWFWEMPDWDMEKQIGEYDTLGWFESYRKLSALLIAGFCFCLLILAFGVDWADLGRPLMRGTILAAVVIYLVLAAFGLGGGRPALALTMGLWTLDRAASILGGIINPLTWLFHIFLWGIFMERLWRAYDVERMRAWRREQGAVVERGAVAGPQPPAGIVADADAGPGPKAGP